MISTKNGKEERPGAVFLDLPWGKKLERIESIQQPKEPWIFGFLSYLRAPFSFLAGFIVTGLACTVFTALSVILRRRDLDNQIIRLWGFLCCYVYGIRIKASGLENLPDQGCLLLFNHSSLFDIPIMYSTLRKDYRYGAKAELFKVPIFGTALKIMGSLPIHRARRHDVLKLYQESVERVHGGESFALAPEGTRQKDPAIGEFKKGPFIFGIQAQAPLVPVVIKGALETLDKDSWIVNRGRWHREVKLEVLPPVETKGLEQKDIEEAQKKVRSAMVAAYENLH